MPLINKILTNAKLRLLKYISCCPCIWTTAVCYLAFCQGDKALALVSSPCQYSRLHATAYTIATRALSYLGLTGLETMHAKLTALNTATWQASQFYTCSRVFDDNHEPLLEILTTRIYTLINNYNFGTIKSEHLTAAEISDIGELLRETIFEYLPDPKIFFTQAHQENVDTCDNAALDSFLVSTLLTIAQEAFIKHQLSAISDILVAHRANQTVNVAISQDDRHRSLIESAQPPSYATSIQPALSSTTPAVLSPKLLPYQNHDPLSSPR